MIPGFATARREGFTLVEVTVALLIGALLMAALAGAVNLALDSGRITRERVRLVREADAAMHLLVRMLRGSPRLLLPQPDRAATGPDESRRSLLALLLDPRLDRDRDGFPDVDMDRDGRIDEDPKSDLNADSKAGIRDVDDDLDGLIDEGHKDDDDEDGLLDEELPNGLDDDGDGMVDEDLAGDLNQDGSPGETGVDDDGDGSTDESMSDKDDDEDEDGNPASVNEDGWDVVLIHVVNGDLVARIPLPHAIATVEILLASDIAHFEAHRLPATGNERAQVVEVSLTLGSGDAAFTLVRRVRVGGA